MIDPKVLDDMSRRLVDAMPAGLRNITQDVDRNLRSALQSGLARLDLVTREEFDIQVALLARTREKVEALEQRVAELESKPAAS